MLKRLIILVIFIPSIGFSGIINQTCINSLGAGGDINNENVHLICTNNVVIPDPLGPLNSLINGFIVLVSGFIGLFTAPPPPMPTE